MNTFLVTETEPVKAQACVRCIRWPENMNCANPHICLHRLPSAGARAGMWLQVLLEGVGEMWLRFPGITQNNVGLGASIGYIVGKNFSPQSQTLLPPSGRSIGRISLDCRRCVHPLQETLKGLLETQKATEPWGWSQCIHGRCGRNLSPASFYL